MSSVFLQKNTFQIRKNVLEYDDVLNKQRQIIYAERDKVLDGVDIHPQIVEMLKEYVYSLCSMYLDETKPYYEWDLEPFNRALEDKLLPKETNLVTESFVEDKDVESVSLAVYEYCINNYETLARLFPIIYNNLLQDGIPNVTFHFNDIN